eukprot:TRINITY_DN58999_c0_g1_i1.p1 TRINITY_DN58999_c0_g1~~TRINITY_DN58999_c0_g1_i1.p1  ORF type:complete len:542 (+),score=66.76 TRINITY_DN58999_c0_g1_i1:51-1676(+)
MGQACGRAQNPASKESHELETLKPPPLQEYPHVDLWLPFRTVAKLYAGSFFATMAAGALATYTSTNYSPETDKITLFYGMFNPCIFFDHYPAKLVATVGLGVFLLLGFVYTTMVFLYKYKEKHLFQTIYIGTIWSWVTLLDLLFLNAMTTNLYPLEDKGRHLHGVHWHNLNGNTTISLLETEPGLSQPDIEIVKLHTTFYIIWILGQVLFTVMLAGVAQGSQEQVQSAAWKVAQRILVFVSWFGMLFHAGAMLVIILHKEAKVEWYMRKDLENSLQHWIIFIDAWVGTSVWGWVPVMFFRFILPPGTGIRLTFSLEKLEINDGDALPERWVGRSMSLIASIGVLGAILHTSWESDTSNLFRIASAMRTKPFAYFGAPMYLLAVVLLGVGLGLTLIQWNLRDGKWRTSLLVNAIVCFASFYSSTVIILERTNFSDYIMCTAFASYLVWVLQLNYLDQNGSVLAALAYTVVLIAICVLAMYTQQWLLYFLFMAMLFLYNYVVPDGPLLCIGLCKLEETVSSKDGIPYATIMGQQAQAELHSDF